MVSYSMFRPFTAELLIVLILIVVDNGLVHLMDIARYFNGNWKYDPTKKDEVGYMICYDKFAKVPYYYSQNINSNTDV